ncbi:MAG: hypothetical protein ACLQU4_12605 [Limisphaerales bacterium]
MRYQQRARDALSVVSYLFLFVGLMALVLMISHAVKGYFHFNFGILGIGIFAGLRRYSRIWRMCALMFIWYGIITLSIALFFCLCDQSASASALYFSHRLSTIPPNWLSIPLAMALLVTLWQYRVLTHPAIRRLFEEEPQPSTARERAAVGAPINGAVVK